MAHPSAFSASANAAALRLAERESSQSVCLRRARIAARSKCGSNLLGSCTVGQPARAATSASSLRRQNSERKSAVKGKRGSVRGALGGRRIMKKTINKRQKRKKTNHGSK